MNGTQNYVNGYNYKLDSTFKNKVSDNYILPYDFGTTIKQKYKEYLAEPISYIQDSNEFQTIKNEMASEESLE